MSENLSFNKETKKSFYSRLVPSDLDKGDTNREFFQYNDDPSKIIRVDSLEELTDRYDNMVDPIKLVELSKKLFSEVNTNYNIKVPAEIILDKNIEDKDAVYIITDRVEGESIEKTFGKIERSSDFLEKLEDLYISISKYYLDKLKNKEAHLADLNNMSQYVYGKKKGDTKNEIYLVDTDLYLNKGDVALLHNVKWLVRHMPIKFDGAIENIRKIIETPLNDELSENDKIIAGKEINETLIFLDGLYKKEDKYDEVGFIPTTLD